MAQQTAHWHFGCGAVLQHLVLEVVFSLLDVVALAAGVAIVGAAVLISVHLHIITVHQKYRWVLGKKFLQTCQRQAKGKEKDRERERQSCQL